MPFAYYEQLSRTDQAIYRASDAVTYVRLPGAGALAQWVSAIEAALCRDDRGALELAARRLARSICDTFSIRAPRVEVLEVRPTFTGGELHGLYRLERSGRATIMVWMRTARHARVVAFRTFLRTLLHELLHHLDFHVLQLPASFHTEGFFKRESSMFHQLVPGAARSPRRDRSPVAGVRPRGAASPPPASRDPA